MSKHRNRLVMMCASLNDVTSWPFWKFLQLKKVKSVTDFVMLAFTSESGTFEARIEGSDATLKNLEHVKEFRPEVLDQFLEKWHIPGSTYFIYGGHGMGDYLEVEQDVHAVQVHELANIMGKKQYQGILFDACFMASLDCVYSLRNNTRYIGCSEGYMWEHDFALDNHIFNTYTASAMSRFKDPLSVFQAIQRDYCSKSIRGDFSILDTTHVEALHEYVQAVIVPRVYDRARYFSQIESLQLSELAIEALRRADELIISPNPRALPRRKNDRDILVEAVQYEHSLYPAEAEDKHVLDLFQMLLDVARQNATLVTNLGDARRCDSHCRTESAALQGRMPSSMLETPQSQLASLYAGDPGISLFNKVVVQFEPPRDPSVYATKLGGMSLIAHELSHLSKPLVGTGTSYNKAAFQNKTDEFLTFFTKAKKHQASSNSAGGVLLPPAPDLSRPVASRLTSRFLTQEGRS